ncbi:hypothetical protein BJAS_P2215 [Bathymodiolus japonicus methanotrophic gill symbiont]|uniref:hypothetical protein n=1 Tax=Bathymodiolus japonicus methanotrophic gill symbiont TaxID=113269 RepID=UPI001B62454A|nr:hypothetical protein [Bathymodiolus japonicus methanotrophic gill symbiont]GFO72190.1 hypothetical protein BJAS_P2215 [Bathymodiolus japonicus methanotrophic gill symbiont]
MATTNGSTAIRDKILASLARYRALRIGKFPCAFWRLSARPGLTAAEEEQARHATSQHSGTPVTNIHSPTQRMGDALVALRPSQLRTKPCSVKTTSNGWTAIRDAILASLARY